MIYDSKKEPRYLGVLLFKSFCCLVHLEIYLNRDHLVFFHHIYDSITIFSIYYFFNQSQWSKLQDYSLVEALLQRIRVPTALDYTVRFHERERRGCCTIFPLGIIIAHLTSTLVRTTEQISLGTLVLWELIVFLHNHTTLQQKKTRWSRL